MTEYTDQQRIARAFLTESTKTLTKYLKEQDGYIRTAIRYRLPVEVISEITRRDVGEIERIGGANE